MIPVLSGFYMFWKSHSAFFSWKHHLCSHHQGSDYLVISFLLNPAYPQHCLLYALHADQSHMGSSVSVRLEADFLGISKSYKLNNSTELENYKAL